MASLKAHEGSKTIRVLHVDADASLLEISKLMLLDLNGGFVIDQACCVDEAFKKLSDGNYDVVVSDYEMPKKDGLQFLKELRENNNQIPFILFTGKGREEVAIKALNLGADGYHNKQGNPETVYGELAYNLLSLVEKTKTKKALEESEKRYRALMEQASEAIFIHNIHGRLIDVNEKACRTLGYSKEELLKMAVIDIDGDATDNQKGLMWPKVVGGESFTFESSHKRKDGSIFPVEVSLGPITVASEILVIGLSRDISERKVAEEKVKCTFAILERVGESVDAGLAVIGKDYRVVWANKRLMSLGVAPNKKCYETFNNLGVVCPDCGVEKVFKQNVSLDVHEYKTVDSKGETIWVELRVTPLKDKNGNITAALELAVPITERKQAEAALKASLAKYRDLADSLPEIVCEIDLEGKLTYANERAFEITGYTKEDMAKGICIFDLIEQKDKGRARDYFNKTVTSIWSPDNEYVFVRKDGSVFPVIIVSKPIVVENQPVGLKCIAIDITYRKKIEKEFAYKQALVQEIVNSSDALIFSVDKNYLYTSFNIAHASTMKAIYGVDIQVGKSILDYISDAKDREKAKQNIDKTLSGEHLIEESFSGADKFVRKYFLISHSPIRDAKGETLGVVVVSNDISQHKIIEEELKTNQLKTQIINEKLHVVGGLTRHDVGNKLMTIKANVYLLNKRIGDDPEFAKYLERINSALDGADEIIEFSRTYEKIGLEQRLNINVENCFNEAAALFPELSVIRIVNECQGLTVLADSLLRQLFYNLIDNSLKHGEKVTQIRLNYKKDVDGVKLFYEDDGFGIPEENKSKIFSGGFTTSNSSGLGLRLIKKMLEVYSWSMTEEGEPGKGAKFVIAIPKFDKTQRIDQYIERNSRAA